MSGARRALSALLAAALSISCFPCQVLAADFVRRGPGAGTAGVPSAEKVPAPALELDPPPVLAAPVVPSTLPLAPEVPADPTTPLAAPQSAGLAPAVAPLATPAAGLEAAPAAQTQSAADAPGGNPPQAEPSVEQRSDQASRTFDGASLKRPEFAGFPAMPGGAASWEKPPQAALDPFGRDVGWDKVPAEPAEAPRSMAEVSLAVPPGARHTPSPEDWRDETFYSVIIDRFGRRAPFTAWGDPADGRSRHGGNIRGLIDKLDYIQGLGATTLLVNPVVMSPPAGSHQYWAIHYLAVDPQIGTMADFKELVAKAHQRGMRVVLDMVFNHTGPILEYEGGYKFGAPRGIKKWNYPLKPAELASPEHFTRRGDISDWDAPEQVHYGDLPGGINRLATENPATQGILLTIAKWWLLQTDVDGFRLDVYKHVSPSFWDRFFPEIRAYAATLGKKNFLLVGELYNGNPQDLVPELRKGRLDSAYNYPAYYWDRAALRGAAATRALEMSFHMLRGILGGSLDTLLRFLDNHDRPHFLGPADPVGLLRFALAHTLMSVGIPYLYYGDEQAFRHVPANEHLDLEQSREDMFPGGRFRNPAAPADGFDASSPTYALLGALGAARKAHPALRRGEQYVRWSDPQGPGIFAFSRIHGDEEVLVVLNSAGEPRSARMWVDANLTPNGAELVDELDPAYGLTARSADGWGSQVSVEVPAYGARVLVRRTK